MQRADPRVLYDLVLATRPVIAFLMVDHQSTLSRASEELRELAQPCLVPPRGAVHLDIQLIYGENAFRAQNAHLRKDGVLCAFNIELCKGEMDWRLVPIK